MGENKHLRKKIEGFTQQVVKHEQKIADELAKIQPNFERIAKWEKDLGVFRGEIAKVAKKLPGGKK